jgi:Undecaprenyl-phosphate glucose phosphotransferase
MKKQYSFLINPILILGDYLILNISFFYVFGVFEDFRSQYVFILIFLNILWIPISYVTAIYNFIRTVKKRQIVLNVTLTVVLHLLIFVALLFYNTKISFETSQNVKFYTLVLIGILTWRLFFNYLLQVYRKQGGNYRNVVIAGVGEQSLELKEILNFHKEYGYRIKGLFDDRNIDRQEIRGNIQDIKEVCLTEDIDEIFCCLPYIEFEKINELIDFGANHLIRVKLISDLRGINFNTIKFEKYDHIPVLNITTVPLDRKVNRAMKRAFDLVFSILVIVLIYSWLYPIIALLIKIESKGPVIFKQERTGINNSTFVCYKFRTMVTGNKSEATQATKSDSRITRIGNFLRKTSLDELPQFLNVLKGEMSVVGPRPHMVAHTEQYSKIIEKFMSRHLVKPGITGLAQAKGFRGETKDLSLMVNRVKLDRFYVNYWSLILDIKIIILTVLSILKGQENAY